jgi:hypothetical protein
MSDDTTPKPCPFCGESAAAAEHIAGPYFGCMNNDCDGALASGFMPSDVWNSRPIEDALRARAEAAEAALATARAEGAAADALLSDGLEIVESLSGGYDVWCDAVRRRLTGGPVEDA